MERNGNYGTSDEAVSVSIIIPAKNEGPRIGKCLEAVFHQEGPWNLEVIVIDSGSADNTLEVVHGFQEVRLKQIPAEAFGHGKTRNLGAEISGGDYIVFLNADAVPADRHWLASMIRRLEGDQTIAGAFSRHLPHPGCYLYMVRDLLASMPDDSRLRTKADSLDFMIFSTVSCAIPRTVFQQFPFDPRIAIAEDQQWGRQVLEKGYKIAYEAGSPVYHSHNYSAGELYRIKRSVGASTSPFKNRIAAALMGIFPVIGGIGVKFLGDIGFILFKRHDGYTFSRRIRQLGIAFNARVASLWGRYVGWISAEK